MPIVSPRQAFLLALSAFLSATTSPPELDAPSPGIIRLAADDDYIRTTQPYVMPETFGIYMVIDPYALLGNGAVANFGWTGSGGRGTLIRLQGTSQIAVYQQNSSTLTKTVGGNWERGRLLKIWVEASATEIRTTSGSFDNGPSSVAFTPNPGTCLAGVSLAHQGTTALHQYAGVLGIFARSGNLNTAQRAEWDAMEPTVEALEAFRESVGDTVVGIHVENDTDQITLNGKLVDPASTYTWERVAGTAPLHAYPDAADSFVVGIVGQSLADQGAHGDAALDLDLGTYTNLDSQGGTGTYLSPDVADFGHSMGLLEQLATVDRAVHVIERATGGTSLAVDWLEPGGLEEQFRALVLKSGRIPTDIIWNQGQADAKTPAHAAAYEANALAMFAGWRALWGASLRIHIVRIRADLPAGTYVANAAVRTAHDNLIAADALNFLVNNDDLPIQVDGIHLTGPGTRTSGQRSGTSILNASGL